MSTQQQAFRGFANPVDPQPAELRAWAYHPDSVRLDTMPREWDILVASNDKLTETLFALASDVSCPARRFALHCLYIFAADAIRTGFRAHKKSKVRKYVEQAEERGDAQLAGWAHNVRVLQRRPDLFDYYDWNEGGLVRNPRRIS